MEYQALYRKYRPRRFDEVVGQGHVTATLAKEIVEGRVAHAYLFSGPRGTGKTTTARLLAKSLNCPGRGGGGEPCNDCPSCAAVTSSSSMDVVELDAASHNKVEDIRDIRSSVSTVASVGGARRVFILDEAHMLTKAASNALLKTLEEPPDHVHFVLATTEPYRLLDTIRSRSQRFDFHLVPVGLIAGLLERVSGAEGYQASPKALSEVARRAAGSVRDALSLLEQTAALDGSVTEEGIQRALGVAGRETMLALADAMASEDAAAALELVAGLSARGVDLRRFAGDAMSFFRGVFLAMYNPKPEELVDEPAEVVSDWQKVSALLSRPAVTSAIDQLGEALVKLREGREERMMLELAVLKLVRPELDDSPAALLSRIEQLERGRGAAPARPAPPVKTAAPAPPPAQRPAAGRAPPKSVAGPAAAAPAFGAEGSAGGGPLDRIWPQLVARVAEDLGPYRVGVFREAVPGGIEGSTLVFEVSPDKTFLLEKLTSDAQLAPYIAELAGKLLDKSGLTVSFRLMGAEPAPAPEEGPPAEAPPPPPPRDPPPPPETPPPEPPPSEPPTSPDGVAPPGRADAPRRPAFVDPLPLLQEELGATVLEESPS